MYTRLIAPGSCLVISCAAYDDEALAKRLAAEYTAGQFVNHTREDVVSFFAGLELVGPGVTEAQTWRPWMPRPVLRHREGHVLACVARVNPDLQRASLHGADISGTRDEQPSPQARGASRSAGFMHFLVMPVMRRMVPGSHRS